MNLLCRAFGILVTAVVVLLVYGSRAYPQQATVREETRTFRTYPFSDPNPVARMGNIYPYYRFEGYSAKAVMKDWKVITLENPYVKVLIAPEIGGKVLGAFVKSTGEPFIYFNNVVKFREIAMRGPWTSGGIEFNFGDIGHAPSTACPVDHLVQTNADGSVSCFVGTLDLPSRTEWRVEIRLPKDKAYFETRSFWYNPTELSTSLYHWMNAAAAASDDLYFIYPGAAHIDHGGIASPWPVDPEGKNLALYRNNAFGSSKSYHVLGTYTDFFGLGWWNKNLGVIHLADYVDKPGKKLWLWALSREGEIWKDLLTDPDLGNSQYVEFQSGLLFNQALPGSSLTPFKHRTFAPFSEQRFTEAWLPFTGIGNVVQASTHGLLNVERHINQHRSAVIFGVCPLEQVNDELVVTHGASELYRRKLSLKPLESFVDSVLLPRDLEFSVRLGSHLKYESVEGKHLELDRPRQANQGFDWSSAAGLAADGTERARQRDYAGALERYETSLAKDSLYSPALVGAGDIAYRRMDYDRALAYARKALANDTYDPDANFLYGIIQRRRGDLIDAIDGFGAAARSTEYRSSAFTALAEVACLQRRWDRALEYAERALDYDRYSIGALRARAVAFRKQGRREDAFRTLEDILRIDPLAHFARMERYLLQPDESTRQAFVSAIRAELPAEVYLELAAYYRSVGLLDDAVRSLAPAPSHPIVLYWRAFLNSQLGLQREAEMWLREAAGSPYRLVFPFRSETAEILEWAATRSKDWAIRYYQALLYWSKGRSDEARQFIQTCGNPPAADASFYITRANLFNGVNDSAALGDYRRAVAFGPNEWRSFSVLAAFYNDHAQYRDGLETVRSGAKLFPENYVLQFECARSLLFNHQYRDCLSALDTLTILPFEGAGYGRELHRQAAVLAAVGAMREGKYQEALALVTRAREWPERLGVGKPYDVDSRIEDYLEGLCRMRMGASESASTLFRAVVQQTEGRKARDAQYIVHLLSLQQLGQGAEVSRTLDTWAASEPENPVATWALKTLRDRRKQSDESPATRQWNPIPIDPNFPMVREIASLTME